LHYANKTIFVKLIKFSWKLILSWEFVPWYIAFTFWILENFTSWFDLIWNQNAKDIKKSENIK
jgi:hypothetical protein